MSLPEVNFTTTTGRQGCNAINIQFVNQSTNADSYLWDFGDGTISSLEHPIHSYMDPGHYDVSLTIFRGNCSNTLIYPQYIRVDTAHAEFSLAETSICMPYDVQFTDMSANPVSWVWNFGTGDTAYVQNPLYTYHDYTGMVISGNCRCEWMQGYCLADCNCCCWHNSMFLWTRMYSDECSLQQFITKRSQLFLGFW